MIFRDLDNVERAIRLALVERIDEVPASAIAISAGRMRLSRDGILIPLTSCGPLLPDVDRVRVLRISDGLTSIGYVIAEVIDIVDIDTECERALMPGIVAGVTLVGGRPVELIDSHWLFAEASRDSGNAGAQPLCMLSDASDPWSRQVLLPLLRSAGYRVTFPDAADAGEAEVMIACAEGTSLPEGHDSLPVIRLTAEPEPAEARLVYRYDRQRLLDALRAETAITRKTA